MAGPYDDETFLKSVLSEYPELKCDSHEDIHPRSCLIKIYLMTAGDPDLQDIMSICQALLHGNPYDPDKEPTDYEEFEEYINGYTNLFLEAIGAE
jgi:hypothetical protein